MSKVIYLIGSLRNPEIPKIANTIRAKGFEVFDDWFAAGEKADDSWRDYEKQRGHSYKEALAGYAAKHVFAFDKLHLNRCDGAVLVMPAGKSGHLELGYVSGIGKPAWVLFDSVPERYDVMTQFATAGACFSEEELLTSLQEYFAEGKEKEVVKSSKEVSTVCTPHDVSQTYIRGRHSEVRFSPPATTKRVRF